MAEKTIFDLQSDQKLKESKLIRREEKLILCTIKILEYLVWL